MPNKSWGQVNWSNSYNPPNVQNYQNYDQKKVKVWGCIDANNMGVLVRYEGRMDSEKYI